jgi:hypothetical protein
MKPRSLTAAFGCGATANRGPNWLATGDLEIHPGSDAGRALRAAEAGARRAAGAPVQPGRAWRGLLTPPPLSPGLPKPFWCSSYDQPGHMSNLRAMPSSSSASFRAASASTTGSGSLPGKLRSYLFQVAFLRASRTAWE